MSGQGPGAIRIEVDPGGKPFWPSSPFHFNLSHKWNRAACSIARFPVGVDLEAPPSDAEAHRRARLLAGRFFTRQEKDFLAGLPQGDWPDAFARIFTLKESLAKATGEGLARFGREIPLPLRPVTRQGGWEYVSREMDGLWLGHAAPVEHGPFRYRIEEWKGAG